MPRISIIIVSWNVRDLLVRCLRSIELAKGEITVEVIVIDNASSDGTVERVHQEFPTVQIIANSHNIGFAAANNLGLRQATGEYVLLLNPDTELTADTLTTTVRVMAEHPRVGALGCQLRNTDGSLQPSVRSFPWARPIMTLLLKLPRLTGWKFASIDQYMATDFDYTKPACVDQIMGAFMLLRREALTVGELDERFFIWFEEVDLCRRLWAAGWSVCYTPETHIIHHGGQSFAQEAIARKQKHFFESAWKYFRKHGFRRPNSNFRYGYPT